MCRYSPFENLALRCKECKLSQVCVIEITDKRYWWCRLVSVGASWFLHIFAIYSSTPIPPTLSQISNVTPVEILSAKCSEHATFSIVPA